MSLFTGDALFDIVADDAGSTLTLAGDWTATDFSSFVPGSFFNQGQSVNLNDANENVVTLNPGDQFAIELILNTAVYAEGAFEAVARANFDSTGGFTVSTDAPGASFVQVDVPESTILTQSVIGLLALSYWRRRRA